MITGIILAAGQSRRMGESNKLTKIWKGKPLVRHGYDAAQASRLDKLIVVSGHEAPEIEAVLAGANIVHNPNYKSGMASSIGQGVEAAGNVEAIMILLGDMPLVTADHINNLIDRFEEDNTTIITATVSGKLGNPVLFSSSYFKQLMKLEGDRGARRLIEECENLTEVEIGTAGARDFDTDEAFKG